MTPRLKLYLLRRTDAVSYDEYDAFVVAAKSHQAARKLAKEMQDEFGDSLTSTITRIGVADGHIKEDIVLSSFRAG